MVFDQGLAAFIIANNKPGLAAFIVANKHALWVNFYKKYCTGTESVHSRKPTIFFLRISQIGSLYEGCHKNTGSSKTQTGFLFKICHKIAGFSKSRQHGTTWNTAQRSAEQCHIEYVSQNSGNFDKLSQIKTDKNKFEKPMPSWNWKQGKFRIFLVYTGRRRQKLSRNNEGRSAKLSSSSEQKTTESCSVAECLEREIEQQSKFKFKINLVTNYKWSMKFNKMKIWIKFSKLNIGQYSNYAGNAGILILVDQLVENEDLPDEFGKFKFTSGFVEEEMVYKSLKSVALFFVDRKSRKIRLKHRNNEIIETLQVTKQHYTKQEIILREMKQNNGIVDFYIIHKSEDPSV